MKHSIREHIVDPIRGKIVKVSTINAELGSKKLDVNGREIFEGDIVKYIGNEAIISFGETSVVEFDEAGLFAFSFGLGRFDDTALEIVGHVED